MASWDASLHGDGIMGLFAPVAVYLHSGWNAGPVQLLAFGSIGVELAGLSCKGCCTCVVTQDGMAEKIMSSAPASVPSSKDDVSRYGVVRSWSFSNLTLKWVL